MYIIVWMIPSSPVAFPILVQISHVHAPSDTCAFRVSTNFNVSAQFSSYSSTCTSVLVYYHRTLSQTLESDVFERKMRAISQCLLIPLVALVTYGLCWLSLLNFNAIQNVVSVWTTFVRSFITKCRLGVVIMIGLSTFTKALLRLGRWTEYG